MEGSKPAPLAGLTTAQRSAYGGIIAGFCLLLTCVLASSVRFGPRSGQGGNPMRRRPADRRAAIHPCPRCSAH